MQKYRISAEGWGKGGVKYDTKMLRYPINPLPVSFAGPRASVCQGPVAEFVSNVGPKRRGLVALQKKPQETVWSEKEEKDYNIS